VNGDESSYGSEFEGYSYQELFPLADYPSEARFVANYVSPSTEQLQSQSEIPSSISLSDILGKVVDITGKTATDIYKTKYSQPALKAVPQSQSGMEKSLFYPLTQTRQTGLSTTVPVSQAGILPSSVAGIPTSYLLIGAVILILIVGFLK
jgi:hypothetical protein